ncbi:hypothetical protein J2T15_004949 [Paenibacillus harenae]|uniref:Uncharacterized protein n=1 Tax=Paenibacillus harenae TaxID=306543 RepID=A0ABT9U8A6_PAEHA|nr:hypothetical protein [Paenibacillus harenae]
MIFEIKKTTIADYADSASDRRANRNWRGNYIEFVGLLI